MDIRDNPVNLCMGCMEPLPAGGGVCPRCGFDHDAARNLPHQLPVKTILAGKYLVGRALGQGGFGVTYIGWDLNLEVKVAIKEYYPEGFVSREQTGFATVLPFTGPKEDAFRAGCERFVREAKVIAKFSDLPCIVHVRDYFRENGTAYIVMEYVDGMTMQQYAAKKGGRLPAQEVLSLLHPLLPAIAEVHAANLLHRDISPDNIMIKQNGAVKLLDFGAARQVSLEGEHSNTINVKHGYAPEEQYRTHGQQGPWTDVYALAATIYKLVTGVTPPQAMDRAMSDTALVPPNDLGAGFTPAQQSAIIRALAVRAKDRTQDMQQFEHELYGTEQAEAAQPEGKMQAPAPPVQTPVQTPQKKKRFPAWAFVVGAVLLLLFFIILVQSSLSSAMSAFDNGSYSEANRHIKASIIGILLYPDDKPLMEAGLLIEDGQYNKAISILETLDSSYVKNHAALAKKEARYRQAAQFLEDGEYQKACDLYESLGTYRDSATLRIDTITQWGDSLIGADSFSSALTVFDMLPDPDQKIKETYYRWGRYYLDKGDELNAYDKLQQAGDYSDAAERRSSLRTSLYETGVKKYRSDDLTQAKKYFDALSGYQRSKDYLTLIQLKNKTSSFTRSDVWDKLVPLIGFEDAGDLIFFDGWGAIYFMEGSFASNPYYIDIFQNGANWYGRWYISRVSHADWYFFDGQFYTGDVARFTITALTRDSISITILATGETVVMNRQ